MKTRARTTGRCALVPASAHLHYGTAHAMKIPVTVYQRNTIRNSGEILSAFSLNGRVKKKPQSLPFRTDSVITFLTTKRAPALRGHSYGRNYPPHLDSLRWCPHGNDHTTRAPALLVSPCRDEEILYDKQLNKFIPENNIRRRPMFFHSQARASPTLMAAEGSSRPFSLIFPGDFFDPVTQRE